MAKFSVPHRPDYIYCTLSADQTATLSAGTTAIAFDEETQKRGDLDLDTVTNVGRISGLKAGRVYRLTGSVKTAGASVRMHFQWYDVTGAAWLGTESAIYSPEFNSGGHTSQPMSEAIFTPSSDSEVELRYRTGSSTTVDIDADAINDSVTYAIIQEI